MLLNLPLFTTSNTTKTSVRGLQPFDVSCANPFFKSSGGMATAAAMGFPFTVAQWKELERQAIIYKYMMASLPVPPHLLYSSFSSNFSSPSTFTPASYYLGKYGSEISMRWSGNSKDAEPGRCRRTDGKKWRCSRDVAPNQRYCERHMHRGRPRSRKHVEQLLQQQQNNDNDNDEGVNAPITKKTRLCDSSSSNPQSIGSSPQSCGISDFDHPLVSGGNSNSFDDSRNLAWTDEQQWSQLVKQTNKQSLVFQNQFERGLLNSSSNTSFNPKSAEMGLLEKPLIDAWSSDVAANNNRGGTGNKFSLSSLDRGGDTNVNAIDEEMCQIHMGLGLIDSWVSTTSTPGGPLAEVLRSGNPATPEAGENEFVTPPTTTVSSPSGVLQKTFATVSDSSGNNSPTVYNNSKASSEMPFHWLN